MSREFAPGDLVEFRDAGRVGEVGIVSRPISRGGAGHVLTLDDGHVVGANASIDEVRAAGDDSTGFVQLATSLIKLGSHVIEQRLIVYRG
jgi:hypothetical protein